MKYIIAFCLFLIVGGVAAQNSQTNLEFENIQLRNEQLKAETNAPNPADFRSKEEYHKSKTNWMKENPETYEKIVAAPEPKKKSESIEVSSPE
jgi:hypothetical protein